MASASHLQLQEEIDIVKADILQAKQDLCAAEDTGDEKALAYHGK